MSISTAAAYVSLRSGRQGHRPRRTWRHMSPSSASTSTSATPSTCHCMVLRFAGRVRPTDDLHAAHSPLPRAVGRLIALPAACAVSKEVVSSAAIHCRKGAARRLSGPPVTSECLIAPVFSCGCRGTSARGSWAAE
eukprot:scaffold1428_cov259-Pinguiococcus_pyrenoidosus.AAC.11